MSNYNTGNPVPSVDPRDLDDNATVFDLLLQSPDASVPDRLGVPRKTWAQMEDDAAALVSPNVAALAAVTAAADKGVFFNAAGPVGMGTYTLTSFNRTLGAAIDAPAFRGLISAMAPTDTGAYAGSAASLTTSRSISATGDAAWTVNFNGTANATAAITLANSGVGAGTYGSVTVNAKGLVTAASVATPVANGGTGQTTIAAAAAALAVPKLAWAAYTPVITPTSGTFTTTSATGSYVVISGICHFQAGLTITTKGTGTFPIFTLPAAALAGSAGQPIPAREAAINGKTGTASIATGLTTASCADYAAADLVTGNGAVITIQGSYPVA